MPFLVADFFEKFVICKMRIEWSNLQRFSRIFKRHGKGIALEYKAKTTHTTMSIRFKIQSLMPWFLFLLTLWYTLFLLCTPVFRASLATLISKFWDKMWIILMKNQLELETKEKAKSQRICEINYTLVLNSSHVLIEPGLRFCREKPW